MRTMSAAARQNPQPLREDAPTPDGVIVRRVLDGDMEAFSLLVHRYQERFHRFAVGMVGDHDAATDLVQDAFVSMYGKLDSCRDLARFESWAYQTLRNRCRDYLKNVRRGHERFEDSPTLISFIGTPEPELERSELRRNLRQALSGLPGGHREAFLLKHLEGRTYEDIAELLQVSTSAVKMRVHRAREMLREALVECHVDEYVTIP